MRFKCLSLDQSDLILSHLVRIEFCFWHQHILSLVDFSCAPCAYPWSNLDTGFSSRWYKSKFSRSHVAHKTLASNFHAPMELTLVFISHGPTDLFEHQLCSVDIFLLPIYRCMVCKVEAHILWGRSCAFQELCSYRLSTLLFDLCCLFTLSPLLNPYCFDAFKIIK